MNLLGLGLSQSRFSPRKLRPSLWLDASRGVYQDAAVQFTAADKSWLRIADASQTGLDPGTDDFLIAFWVRFDTLVTWGTLVYKGAGASGAGYPGYFLFTLADGSLISYFSDGSASRCELSCPAGTVAAGEWIHLAFAFDRSAKLTVYKNGEAVGNGVAISAQAGSVNSTVAFDVGALSGVANYFLDGRIDSLMIFKKPDLSPVANDIIAWAYNGGSGRLCAEITPEQKTAWGAVSGWEFAEASGQRKDSWGTNHLDEQFGDIISPTVNNGGFETLEAGGADVFGTWVESASGGSTINAESSDVYDGSYAARLDIDGDNNIAMLALKAATIGKVYAYSVYAKAASGTPSIYVGSLGASKFTLSTEYEQFSGQRWFGGDSLIILNASAPSNSIYIDNVTLRAAEILRAPGIVRAIAANGDGVSYWQDQSTGGKHAAQITLAKRPTLVTSGINSRPVIRGDGVDDYLGVPAISLTGGFAISAVLRCSANPSALTVLGKNANDYIALTDNTTVTVRIGGGTATAFTVPAIGTGAHILTVTRDAANAVRVYLDGAESTTGAKTLAGTLAVEQVMANAGGYFAGDVADALVFDGAKSAGELARIHRYLASRYGVTI